jgi:hypothetical protein
MMGAEEVMFSAWLTFKLDFEIPVYGVWFLIFDGKCLAPKLAVEIGSARICLQGEVQLQEMMSCHQKYSQKS